MYGCGRNSAVQPHSMGGVMVGRRGTHTHTHTHTQEHTQERTRKCCTGPLATYPLKSARKVQHQQKGNNNNSKQHLMQHLNSPGVVALLYCEVEKRL